MQLYHAVEKLTPFAVSIVGNAVKYVQFDQAPLKADTFDVLIVGKSTKALLLAPI